MADPVAADHDGETPDFLVHAEGDDVAVAVRDVPASVAGVAYLDSGRRTTITTVEAVPLGHKVALRDLGEEADVMEYGVRVALTRRPVAAGQAVHTHNVRSARWHQSV